MTRMTASEITGQLSEQAREVLALMGSHQIGAVVQRAGDSRELRRELFRLGVISHHDGLTIKGSVVAARLQREWEDANL